MLSFFKTTRGRVVAAVLTSAVVVALAVVAFRDALPIVPAALAAVWVPVFAPREPDSLTYRRLVLVLTGGLAVLAGIGVLVFVLAAT